jgi:protocatechuate 3,4-dioxygenase beta subunit
MLLSPVFTLLLILVASTQAPVPVGNVVIAGPEEKGERLIVHGQVFDPAGQKPVPGVTVYAYQTDVNGVYNRFGVQSPRLRGWVKTDAEGKFVLDTIRPGSYPGRSNPAHIHFEVSGGGYPRQWAKDLNFSDDPLITKEMLEKARALGKFANIAVPKRDARGVLHASIALRLSERSNF